MNLADHGDHKWSQQGRCVYCDTCGVRLFQGKLPAPGKQKEMASDTDTMLAAARAKFEAKTKKEWDERTPEQNQAWEDGRASYIEGESVMDRMRRGNPHKGTDLAKWHNMGWTNAEFAYYERRDSSEQPGV